MEDRRSRSQKRSLFARLIGAIMTFRLRMGGPRPMQAATYGRAAPWH